MAAAHPPRTLEESPRSDLGRRVKLRDRDTGNTQQQLVVAVVASEVAGEHQTAAAVVVVAAVR